MSNIPSIITSAGDRPLPDTPQDTFPQRSPPRFRPQCTHLTMTRLYGYENTCDNCRRPGAFGWVYRCTQDQEDALELAIDCGQAPTFDDLGREMIRHFDWRRRGPKERQNELSFFDDVTSEQLDSYRPDQLRTILLQREKVHNTAADDVDAAIIRNNFDEHGVGLLDGNALERGAAGRPWMRNHTRPCDYTICPACRPGAQDRAWLSLDAIANGDIPPTAAVGYGFHTLGFRPVVDAELVKGIEPGEPVANHRRAPQRATDSSSATDILALLDEQLTQGKAIIEARTRDQERKARAALTIAKRPEKRDKKPGQLKHSPAVENLAAFSNIQDPNKVHNQGYSIRPPWTPPPSPTPHARNCAKETHAVGLAAEKSFCDGRSSNSLKTNRRVREQLIASVPSSNSLSRLAQSGSYLEDIPYLDEAEYDVGLTLPFDEVSFAAACDTPLIAPDAVEESYFYDHKSPMMQHEEEEGRFRPEPLEVEDGVAVLEESVELGVPDVVKQA